MFGAMSKGRRVFFRRISESDFHNQILTKSAVKCRTRKDGSKESCKSVTYRTQRMHRDRAQAYQARHPSPKGTLFAIAIIDDQAFNTAKMRYPWWHPHWLEQDGIWHFEFACPENNDVARHLLSRLVLIRDFDGTYCGPDP